MSTIPDIICHYQKSIENSEANRPRLLHCIGKLYRLRITVQHLQETGIGRTVNSLRKDDGEVGVAAKALVAKWKAMVAAESSDEDDTAHLDDDDEKSNGSPVVAAEPPKPSPVKTDLLKSSSSSSSKHRRGRESEIDSKKSSSSSKKSTLVGFDFLKPTNEDDVVEEEVEIEKSSSSHKSSHHRTSHHKSSELNKDHHKSNHLKSSDQCKTSEGSSSSSSKSSKKPSSKDGSPRKEHKSSSSQHRKDEDRSKSAAAPSSSSSSSSSKRKHESSSKSSSKSKSDKSPSKRTKMDATASETNDIEFDSSMGTSFADALGMMMPPSSSKSLKSKASSSSSSSSKSVPATSVTPAAVATASRIEPKTEKKTEKPKPPTAPPSLLQSTAQLAPLEPDLSLELPSSISNNYRPLPLNPIVMDCVYKPQQQQLPIKRTMTDEEFGATMSSKNLRTKVYSGVKTGALMSVPTLHELCIRVVQKNIDALEVTGGVPYHILKPVLQLASPDQLFSLENYNPYLIDDTDDLWRHHCNRKFRSQKRRDMETWRDMFLRCTDEQNARLSHLTENIKASQAIAVPVKKTKIAFVDSMVKPPRNVLKKQHQFGTDRKLVATPASRVASLHISTPNSAKLGDTRLKVLAGTRDAAQAQGSSSVCRMKKAPLMAKAVQLMKGRFKR